MAHLRAVKRGIALVWSALAVFSASAQTNSITIQADQPGAQISSNLFGIFFEEINSAGDGGIYAELVRNRSFEDSPTNTPYWTLATSGTAAGQMGLDTSLPLSTTNLHSLKLTMISGAGTVGAANAGYWGMALTQGAIYDLGFYSRGAGLPVTATLESADGTKVYAQTVISGLSNAWQHFAASLTPNASDAAARLRLSIAQAGSVWVDFVSLFPRQTFRQRTNGLRPDLANMLANLRPSFVRFPGGSWVDGSSIANAYHWEPTVGNPANRTPRANLWGYMVDNGLGYHEYLQMCEDIGAEPLFVINCGMDVNQNPVALAQMTPWVQEALDAIQYANGDTNTFWGAQRAANGHPAPFNLKYMEIGNENGGQSYADRYALFYDAIKAQHPQMHLIADAWPGPVPGSRPVELMDEHYYSDPGFFMNNATRYDAYSRARPKVYVGEYAVTTGAGNGNLAGALGEAAFMTGVERNADIVAMASYAPLFANLNNKDWNPDLIYFNGSQVYGTPSYYAQQMFSLNRGDSVLPTTVSVATIPVTNHGAVGLSTWNTQAAFTNVVVTKNSQTLYQSDFTQGSAGWQIASGTWVTTGGVFEQTAGGTDNRATTGDPAWSDYTLTLQAKKLSGAEGFLVMFNVQDSQDWMWLNIGGWGNTQTAVEWSRNGGKTTVPGTAFPQQILTGQWYTIQVQLGGPHVRCYLNGQLIEDFFTAPAHQGAIGLGTWNTQSAYSNLVVTAGSQTLYQSDFTHGSAGWQIGTGTWITTNGGFEQIAGGTDNTATTGSTTWSNYTYNLRALKLGGSEGFLILFNFQNSSNWFWWNIGGWNNTQTGIEYTQNGQKSLLTAVPMQIQTGQWYDISIQLGQRIRCLLNGQLIHDAAYPDAPNSLFVSTALSQGNGQIILKAVNVSSQPLAMQVEIDSARDIAPGATALALTSTSPLDENSLAQPTHVAPITNTITGVSTNFPYTFPANSLTVLRLQQQPDFPVGIGFATNTAQQDIGALSNGVPVRLSSFITNAVSVSYTIDSPTGVLATGVLQFAPGDLMKMLPVVITNWQSYGIIRVTLGNPVNGQLGSNRVYFAQSQGNGGQPILNWAAFPDQTIIYWSDAASLLQQTADLSSPWTTLSNAPSPFNVDFSTPSRFFRLQR